MISRSTDIKAALKSRQRGFLLNPSRFATGSSAAPNPHWASAGVLLHGDGVDGSTTVVDHSPIASTGITVGGTATRIRTKAAAYDGAAIHIAQPGSGPTVSIPYNSQFDFGLSAFTISARIYFEVLHTSGSARMVSKGATPEFFWNIPYVSAGTYRNEIRLVQSGLGANFYYSSNYSLAINTPYHFEIGRIGVSPYTMYFFLNGVLLNSVSAGYNVNFNVGSGAMVLSQANGAGPTFWIEEYQVLKGVCWHTATFTPPTAPYANSA